MTAFRPTSLATMNITHFDRINDNGDEVINLTSAMECKDCSTKCQNVVIKAIGNMPKTIKTWHIMTFDNQMCAYHDIVQYMRICNELKPGFDRFLLQPNDLANVNCRRNFLPINMLKGLFMSYIKLACKNISVLGIKN